MSSPIQYRRQSLVPSRHGFLSLSRSRTIGGGASPILGPTGGAVAVARAPAPGAPTFAPTVPTPCDCANDGRAVASSNRTSAAPLRQPLDGLLIRTPLCRA